MLPPLDVYAGFIDLEHGLKLKRAEREALVNVAIAARRSAATERPAGMAKLSLSRLLDATHPIRGMIRLARS